MRSISPSFQLSWRPISAQLRSSLKISGMGIALIAVDLKPKSLSNGPKKALSESAKIKQGSLISTVARRPRIICHFMTSIRQIEWQSFHLCCMHIFYFQRTKQCFFCRDCRVHTKIWYLQSHGQFSGKGNNWNDKQLQICIYAELSSKVLENLQIVYLVGIKDNILLNIVFDVLNAGLKLLLINHLKIKLFEKKSIW